ncbi:MAG: DNA-processing protein DprA [Acidobacteria bacterium]|nr:DNA-processing protein DprA [Acidobacteriota bacterium]
MTSPTAAVLQPAHESWPKSLLSRMGTAAPPILHVVGPAELLVNRKVALFCSARTPGTAILHAHDAARRMRDQGVTVISGFHSPIEQECLKILLRGKQPIIICPARAIDSLRISAECRTAFDSGRILFLSPFSKQPRRVTKESALRRNQVVAALADEAYVAHIESGGKTDQIVTNLIEWKVPIL